MNGKRERLAEILDRIGVAKALLWARRGMPSPWLPVLTYHRIADHEGERRFDRGVIDATPEQFDRQLSVLTQYFTLIGARELADHVVGRASLPHNALCITFDDGYRDCHDTALPILLRHGARAIFFVATAYTDERRVYWWDQIGYALRNSTRERIDLSYPAAMSLPLAALGPDATLARLARVVKRHRELDLARFLGELFEACGVDWNRDLERRLSDELVMTWDHVRALAAAGMDVQSHTRTHRVLATLAERDLDLELGGSREELEHNLGQPVFAIAYPVGRRILGSNELVDAVRRAGYEIGFSNASGINSRMRHIDPYDVRRAAMDIGLTDALFRCVLAIPYLSRVVA